MKKQEMPFELGFGAFELPIKKQIVQQGYRFMPEKVKEFQAESDAITLLYFSGLISDSTKTKINKKLFIKIMQHLKKVNKSNPTQTKKK